MNDYIGRFAPSPTGALHFGSLVAAVASYCDARHANGKWLLRIEDVDGARSKDSASKEIIRQLALYGFHWDGEIVYQSKRTAYYERFLRLLKSKNAVYRCKCKRQILRELPKGVTGEPIYNRACRELPDSAFENQSVAWRVKVPNRVIEFHDRRCGDIRENLETDCGDFILKRRDGYFAYHLAVVADDIAANVTHVVRGEDLLYSTPRHLYLYELLKRQPPVYLHLPLALGADGVKLSKQSFAPVIPDDALPELFKAWEFLRQKKIEAKNIESFWEKACVAWDARCLSTDYTDYTDFLSR